MEKNSLVITEILLLIFPFLHHSMSPVFPVSQTHIYREREKSPLGNTYVVDSNFNSFILQFRFESHCDVPQMLDDGLFCWIKFVAFPHWLVSSAQIRVHPLHLTEHCQGNFSFTWRCFCCLSNQRTEWRQNLWRMRVIIHSSSISMNYWATNLIKRILPTDYFKEQHSCFFYKLSLVKRMRSVSHLPMCFPYMW